MKRYFISILIVLGLGTFSWAQGTKELFDAKKSQEELEIMKGILSTTLSFVSQNLQRQAAAAATPRVTTGYATSSFRISNINAFYLFGQGAVFVIPSSNFRLNNYYGALGAYNNDMLASLESANVKLAALSREMAQAAVVVDKAAIEAGIRGGVVGGVQGGVVGGVAPAPSPKAAQTPKPPQPPQSQEELRKKLTEQVERTRKSREDMLADREKLQKILVEMKGYLVEALANYGDSLTTVKPNEYINVVITTDDFSGGFSGGMAFGNESDVSRREVISVQKSWITDYKAGRLTLDAFRQKALQYRE